MGLMTRIKGMLGNESETVERETYRCRTCHATFELPVTERESAACTSCGSTNVEAA